MSETSIDLLSELIVSDQAKLSDIHNFKVLILVTNTKSVETRIVSSICMLIASHARPDLVA